MYRAAVSHIEVGSMEEEVAWGRIGASGAGRCGDPEVASWACRGPGPSRVALAWVPGSVPPLSTALHRGGKRGDRCWRAGRKAV
ncbi:hypothetical protein NDU88_002237 [Pleurodeles waltl]|uniref:Uncharacterized protein n=1 Tax=Pleurodeles waltl TaxID=8319 RepID=A0AAV7T1T5_PLEWA|nr:hypothetical protein NDU88_002237 [Pleurodeles waltl]